jgi:apolipoprotein N-acyltransferase
MTIPDILEAGDDPSPLTMRGGSRLGVLVCYEDTLPRNARETVASGADVLFSLIQGSAFENQLTLIQHQRLSVLRAVENGRYFVRCASTGVSCLISPTGRIVDRLPIQTEGTLSCEVPLLRNRTVYNRIGELFPVVCTVLVALCLWSCRRDHALIGPWVG